MIPDADDINGNGAKTNKIFTALNRHNTDNKGHNNRALNYLLLLSPGMRGKIKRINPTKATFSKVETRQKAH